MAKRQLVLKNFGKTLDGTYSYTVGANLGYTISMSNIKKKGNKMRNKIIVALSVLTIIGFTIACTRSYDNHKAYIHKQAAQAYAAAQAKVKQFEFEQASKAAAAKLAAQQADCLAQQANAKVTSLPAVCVKGATTPTVLKTNACAITPTNGQVAIVGKCAEFAH